MCPILTAAEGFILGVGAKMFSCCGARHIPCRRSGFVICRPLPLAQVASSATGGAPIAPHRRPGYRLWCFVKCSLWFYLLDLPNVQISKRLDRFGQAFRYIFESYGLTIVFLKQGTKIIHFLLRYNEIALGFAVVYGVT